MSDHELNTSTERDALFPTSASTMRASTFKLKPFFYTEAAANFLGGTLMLCFPGRILSAITASHLTYPLTPSTAPSTASIQLFQWLGGMTFALSAPLVASLSASATVSERRNSYLTLAAGEIALIAIMFLQAISGGKGAFGAEGSSGGMTVKTLSVAMVILGSTVVGRLWVWACKREWFEDSEERVERPKSRAS